MEGELDLTELYTSSKIRFLTKLMKINKTFKIYWQTYSLALYNKYFVNYICLNFSSIQKIEKCYFVMEVVLNFVTEGLAIKLEFYMIIYRSKLKIVPNILNLMSTDINCYELSAKWWF